MIIAAKIKEYRKKCAMTQDRLAELLCISPQAVSKWECGLTTPDIALLPTLATVLGVSIDELFGYDSSHIAERVDSIIKEAERYFWSGKGEKCEQILTDALGRYPGNIKLMCELVSLWASHLRSAHNKGEPEDTVKSEKALRMAENIIAESTDVFCICQAKNEMASIYLIQNNYDTAKRVIDSMPMMYPYILNDKMRTAAYQLKGEDRLVGATEWKLVEIQELFIACGQEGEGFFEVEKYENALESFNKAVGVLEFFLNPGELSQSTYLWAGMQTHHFVFALGQAGALAKLGRLDEARERIGYAYRIISSAWSDFDTNREYYLPEFRRIFAKYELAAVTELSELIG